MDASNYRFRVLKPLAEAVGIEWLNFQILRRTVLSLGWVRSVPDARAYRRPDGALKSTGLAANPCRAWNPPLSARLCRKSLKAQRNPFFRGFMRTVDLCARRVQRTLYVPETRFLPY